MIVPIWQAWVGQVESPSRSIEWLGSNIQQRNRLQSARRPSLANRPLPLCKGHLHLRGPHTERELSGASKGILCSPNTVHPPQQSWTKSSSFPSRTTRSLVGPHGKWLFRLKPPFCSVFRPRSLQGPRSSSTVVPGRVPSCHPTLPSRPSSFSSYKPSFPRDQPNGFGFARASALPSRTSRRALPLPIPVSSPPVEAATALVSAVKDHVERSGGSTIFLFQLARLVLVLTLLGLPIFCFLREEEEQQKQQQQPSSIDSAGLLRVDSLRGGSKHGRKKSKYKHGQGGGSFSEREWIHLAFCLDYVRRVSSLSAVRSCSLASWYSCTRAFWRWS